MRDIDRIDFRTDANSTCFPRLPIWHLPTSSLAVPNLSFTILLSLTQAIHFTFTCLTFFFSKKVTLRGTCLFKSNKSTKTGFFEKHIFLLIVRKILISDYFNL